MNLPDTHTAVESPHANEPRFSFSDDSDLDKENSSSSSCDYNMACHKASQCSVHGGGMKEVRLNQQNYSAVEFRILIG